MPDAHSLVESGPESETAVVPSQVPDAELAPEEAGADLDMGLELGLAGSGYPAATRAGETRPLPPGLRARAIGRVQRQQGNFATQRMLKRAPVQRADPRGADGDDWLAERIDSASGSGRPIEPQTQSRLEAGLHDDLGDVRIHTDFEAARLTGAVNAMAFTSGRDIFFGSDTYQPGTSQGLELLAHEAAHTVQQASGPVAGTPAAGGVLVSDPADPFEQAAEHAASEVMLTATTSQAPQRIDGTPAPNGQSIQRVERPKVEEEEEEKPPAEPVLPEPAKHKKPEELA